MWKTVSKPIHLITLALLLTSGLAAAPAQAAVTKTFCVNGTSNGAGWTWTLEGIALPGLRVTTQGVPSGGSATDLAQEWVRSINRSQGRPPAYRARFSRTGTDGRAYFTITAFRDFTFGVGDCTLTGNSRGCRFNPMAEEVSSTEIETSALNTKTLILALLGCVIVMALVMLVLRRRRSP